VDNVPQDPYDEVNQHPTNSECLLAQQHTLLWNKDKYLEIAPGQNNKPLRIIYDEHAEELSFPSMFLGQARSFKTNVKVTPFLMATSEIRRKDRRGVTTHTLHSYENTLTKSWQRIVCHFQMCR
jgi:hypothetical protein